jgi:hypothetical protein
MHDFLHLAFRSACEPLQIRNLPAKRPIRI